MPTDAIVVRSFKDLFPTAKDVAGIKARIRCLFQGTCDSCPYVMECGFEEDGFEPPADAKCEVYKERLLKRSGMNVQRKQGR